MVKFTSIFLLLSFSIFGQNPIDNALNYLQQLNTEEIDLENQALVLQSYLDAPLEINNLKRDDITRFPLLNQRHYHTIQKYIRTNGDILSKYELMNLYFFNEALVNLISPFIAFFPQKKTSKTKGELIYKSSWLLNQSHGFIRSDSNRFLGGRSQELCRGQIFMKKQHAFFTWEKDKGEPFRQSHLKGGFQCKFNHAINQLNIGAFSIELGEGLIHSNAVFNPKNRSLNHLYKLKKTIKSNASTNESNYERGIAIQTKLHKINSTYFWSRNALHGNGDDSLFYSFKIDGLHRTNTEIEKRNKGMYSLIGTQQAFSCKGIFLQLNSLYYSSKTAFFPEVNYYNINYNHHHLWNNSFAYRYLKENILLKGEIASDQEGNIALSHFFALNLNELNVLIQTRYFNPKYNSFRSNSLSEGSRVQNERGILFATEGRSNKISYYLSADVFSFINPKYQAHLPHFGREYLAMITKDFTSSSLKLFMNKSIKMQNVSNTSFLMNTLSNRNLTKFYLHYKINLTDDIEFQTRVDYIIHSKHEKLTSGTSHFIQFCYTKKQARFNGRITYFNTDNWDTRIYNYENDVLYHFTIPAYYDKGIRYFVNYSKKINNHFQLWIKYAKTYFLFKEFIGTGNDRIEGNKKSEFRVQLRVKF